MVKNRFEQVDERQDDAITLILGKTGGEPRGSIVCPAALGKGRLSEDQVGPEMPPVEAFRSAVRLANELKAPIVVLDPDKLWQAEWGELFRED